MNRADIWWTIPEIEKGSRVLDLGAGGRAIGDAFDGVSATYLTSDLRRFREAEHQERHDVCKLMSDFEADGPFDVVLYEPPQREAKLRIFELVDGAFESLKVGGRLYLAARKERGAASYSKRIGEVFGNVSQTGRAKRMRVYEATKNRNVAGISPVDPSFFFQLPIPNGGFLTVKNRAGVFSADGFDPGSRFLVETLSPLIGGRVLDFGCGAGTIGMSIATTHPEAELTLVDVNRLAVHCASDNVSTNGLASRITVQNGDGYEGLGDETFDWIVSNPPFHEGNVVTHPLIEGALDHLAPGGKVALVVMRVEPYAKAMERVFKGVEILATHERYSVILAEDPL